MEEFYGEKVEINKTCMIVDNRSAATITQNNKVLMANEIDSQIVILVITDKECSMIKLETNTVLLNVARVKEMIKNIKGNILTINIFTGINSNHEITKTLKELLNVEEEYMPYQDSNLGGIAYDYEDNKYYGVDSNYNFYDYQFNSINKKQEKCR